MTSNRHTRLIIAGGKTGGHLFPGIAVAQAVKARAPEAKILFVGTDAPFETQTLARYGFAHKTILSRPIKGKNPLAKAWSAALVLVSLVQALWIVFRFRADVILGVGGFSSFALVLAARLLGRRTAIHEQNACPGMTNRLLARFSHTLFITFEQTKGMPVGPKTLWVGNPIRMAAPGAGPSKDSPSETAFLDTLSSDDFLILVTGGSQGASSINKAFSGAAALLAGNQNLFIVHQTGKADEEQIKTAYKDLNLRTCAQAFFHDMPAIQDRADLVVARAGAGTLTELAIKGKPAILVPFPHAADDHQTANAKNFSDQGAAILIADKDLDPKALAKIVQDLRQNPEKRTRMATAMKALAMPRAAEIITSHILGTAPDTRKGDQ